MCAFTPFAVHLPIPNSLVFDVHLVTSTAETLRHHANRLCRIDRIPAYLSSRVRTPLRISDLRNKPLRRPNIAGITMLWHVRDTSVCLCVPTYARNTYPGVGSVLRAIIACRPEDSLRPVLSYPSSSLAIVPRQTHDHNPSFPFVRSVPLSLSLSLSHFIFPLPISVLSPLSSLCLLKEKPLVGSSSRLPAGLLFFFSGQDTCLAAYHRGKKKKKGKEEEGKKERIKVEKKRGGGGKGIFTGTPFCSRVGPAFERLW